MSKRFQFCILVGLYVGMKLGIVGVSLGFVYLIFTSRNDICGLGR